MKAHRNITCKRLVLDAYQHLRVQRGIIRFLGRPFMRSRQYVEIDITYRCNLRCNNCNRSCTQAPSSRDISLEAIEDFIAQSINRQFRWRRVRLLGGEPTLHPELTKITYLLRAYRQKHNQQMRIVLCTNGSGSEVRRNLALVPDDIEIKSTSKIGRQRLFRPFNLAPVDNPLFRFADFSAGCRIIEDCGLGLTPQGYYVCAVAGAIDRVFELGFGREQLPSIDDDLRDQLHAFCPLCGHFGFLWPTRKAKMSPTWKEAYRRYRARS